MGQQVIQILGGVDVDAQAGQRQHPGAKPGGLCRVQMRDQGTSAEYKDQFGFSLCVGNFTGNSYDDLAVGVPGEESVLHVYS